MKKKFIWLIMSCLMVAALVLASCAPAVVEEKKATVVTKEPEKKVEKVEEVVEKVGPQYGGIITAIFDESPQSFDPMDGIANQGFYLGYIYDKLFICDWWLPRDTVTYRGEYTFYGQEYWIGHLAESWEWPDNQTLIFNIREGVRWQNLPPVNGREFVADDVKFSIERFMAAPVYVNHMITQHTESISCPDKYTVVIKFKRPIVNMIQYLMYPYMVPREIVDQDGDMKEWRHAAGTGPFMLKDFVVGSSLTYTRNPDHFVKDPEGRQIPYIDGAKLLVVPDLATQVAALRTYKVDLLTPYNALPWDQKQSLSATNPELSFASATTEVPWIFFMRTDIAPFNNTKVRQALEMAINRQEMVDTVFGGDATALSWPCLPTWSCYTPLDELPEKVREIHTYDPVAAKALLAEAGYPNGFNTKLQYQATGRFGNVYGPTAELVKEYWAAIGVDLELETIEGGTRLAYKLNKDYDQIIAQPCGQQEPLLCATYYYQTGGGWNFGLVSDPFIDDLVDKANGEFDYTKRVQMLTEIYTYLAEMVYDIGMPGVRNFCAWHPWVKGYTGENQIVGNDSGQVIARIWLDQDLREAVTGR